jgi:AmmeMemoRadiSam system protein B
MRIRRLCIYLFLNTVTIIFLMNSCYVKEHNKEYKKSDKSIMHITSISEPTHKNALAGNEKMLQCKYYDEIEFKQSVDQKTIEIEIFKKETIKIKGGIVPHHLLAKDMISSFFEIVSVQKPEIIIVIAPNHKGIGVSPIHTGDWSWQTPFGILDAEKTIANSFIDSNIASSNFDLLEEDHSISALVPYIKYYMPDCKIIPILLHGSLGLKDTQQLGKNLQAKLNKEGKSSLIIASVDFSHYLPLEVADEMDKISINAIKERDANTIYQFDNDYMDSPPSIIALLSAMDFVNAYNMHILDHSNSDILSGSKNGETTSYYTVLFY